MNLNYAKIREEWQKRLIDDAYFFSLIRLEVLNAQPKGRLDFVFDDLAVQLEGLERMFLQGKRDFGRYYIWEKKFFDFFEKKPLVSNKEANDGQS